MTTRPASASELQRLAEAPSNKWAGERPKPPRFPLVHFADLKPGVETPYLGD